MKRLVICLLCVVFSLLATDTVTAAEKPNIVLLFIDDWAWNGTPVSMNDGMENSRMPVLQMPTVTETFSIVLAAAPTRVTIPMGHPII